MATQTELMSFSTGRIFNEYGIGGGNDSQSLSPCPQLSSLQSQSLFVMLNSGDSVEMNPSPISDWSSYQELKFSVYNPQTASVSFELDVEDSLSTNYNTRFSGVGSLPSSSVTPVSFLFPLARNAGGSLSMNAITLFYMTWGGGPLYFSDMLLIGTGTPSNTGSNGTYSGMPSLFPVGSMISGTWGTTPFSFAVSDSSSLITPAPINYNAVTVLNEATTPSIVDSGGTSAVEIGMQFTSDTNGYIYGVNFYKAAANTGSHKVSLWTDSGMRLAIAVASNETPSGWQTAPFFKPVAITSGSLYRASVFCPAGHFSVFTPTFPTYNPPLKGIDGYYNYGAGFPSSTIGWNYAVDVMFNQ